MLSKSKYCKVLPLSNWKRKKKKVGIYPLLPTNSKTISCKVFSSDSSTQQQNNKQTLALILKKIN